MNTSMMNALSTMQALQRKMDQIADHMANLNTPGYKRSDVSFKDILTTVQNQPREANLEGRLTPPGLTIGWGSQIAATRLDFSQGDIRETGVETDIAIVGQAMLQIQYEERDENGNFVLDEEGNLIVHEYYTRNGALQYAVTPDNPNTVFLAVYDGTLLRDAETGEYIQFPAHHKLEIKEDGTVWAWDPVRTEHPPIYAGRLPLFHIIQPQSLEKIGEHRYALPEGVQQPERMIAPVNWQDPGAVAVKQRHLEHSNVDLAHELTELISVQRAYQLNARAITSADTMMGLANNLRG